jgi:hypothetical protein
MPFYLLRSSSGDGTSVAEAREGIGAIGARLGEIVGIGTIEGGAGSSLWIIWIGGLLVDGCYIFGGSSLVLINDLAASLIEVEIAFGSSVSLMTISTEA